MDWLKGRILYIQKRDWKPPVSFTSNQAGPQCSQLRGQRYGQCSSVPRLKACRLQVLSDQAARSSATAGIPKTLMRELHEGAIDRKKSQSPVRDQWQSLAESMLGLRRCKDPVAEDTEGQKAPQMAEAPDAEPEAHLIELQVAPTRA